MTDKTLAALTVASSFAATDLLYGKVGADSRKIPGSVVAAYLAAAGTLVSSMTDTWANAGTQFDAIKMNVTNTNSAANSSLLNLQIGSVPHLRFIKEKNLQIFNAFTSEASFESGGGFWASDVYKMGTQKGASGGTARDVYVVTPNLQWTFSDASGNFNSPRGVFSNYAFGVIGWAGFGGFTTANADGVFRMFNSADTDFGRLVWGGASTAFPALARSGIGLAVQLGDGSAGGFIRLATYTVATVPSAATSGAGAMIYVSNEAGGAVLVFSDGSNWKRVTDRATIS